MTITAATVDRSHLPTANRAAAKPAEPVVIETDRYLGENNGDNWTPEGFEKAWKLSLDAFAEALGQPGARRAVLVLGIPGAGKSTHIAAAKRPGDVLLDEAKLVYDARRDAATAVALQSGLPVEVIWVDTPLGVCKDRNGLRASNRRVPDHILEEADRLLTTAPPTPAEGFAAIHRVSGHTPPAMQRAPSASAVRAPALPCRSGCRDLAVA